MTLRNQSFLDLREYELTLTTALTTRHGISGHLFEMIEYYYYFHFWKGVKSCIVISCDVKPEQFKTALEKYDFTDDEKNDILENTFFALKLMVISCNDIIFVDGKINETNEQRVVKAKHIYFLRCNNKERLEKADIVFQDNRLYDELPNSVHYVKKFLFSKFKKVERTDNRYLMYLTSNTRMLDEKTFNSIINKYTNKRILVISNEFKDYFKQDNIDFEFVPVCDIMSKFNEYIYTPLKPNHLYDCSPRFITECAFYGKQIHFESPMYKGLDVRKYDIEHNLKGLELTKDDPLFDLIEI